MLFRSAEAKLATAFRESSGKDTINASTWVMHVCIVIMQTIDNIVN